MLICVSYFVIIFLFFGIKFFPKQNFGLECGLECGLHSKSSGVGNALKEITVVERVNYVDVTGWCPVSVRINIHYEGLFHKPRVREAERIL